MLQDKKILVVDDEPSICVVLKDLLNRSGYQVEVAYDGKAAIQLSDQRYDLVLTDLSLPGASGMEVLDHFKRAHPDTPVIMITAYASVQTAIKALRQGAYDFIVKPFDLDEILVLAERALERTRLIDENRYLLGELKSRYNFDNVIGHTREVQEAYLLAARVADCSASVLILGETGTGKEFLARAIHYQSSRAEEPFIKVNCAALPEALLESELFGHEKGAFTTAMNQRIGRFEMANGGTLFLDEIGDISLSVQVKLLRVLQEKEFERVGGSKTIKVNVRIVAATNRDLDSMMKEGTFREDLYYRLNVICISLPPLRERPNDVQTLSDHFLRKYTHETSKNVKSISSEAMDLLKRHSWRGNIRELENCIERAVILCNESVIRPKDLLLRDNVVEPEAVREETPAPKVLEPKVPEPNEEPSPEEGMTLREMERKFIMAAMQRNGGNQSRAAVELGIDRKTLRFKLKEAALSAVNPSEKDDPS